MLRLHKNTVPRCRGDFLNFSPSLHINTLPKYLGDFLSVSVQAYMQTFGALTQPLSLESISRHSINFYEAQWQQHQMELCQPPYPRSNTISVFSDISSDSSFSSGSPERFSGGAPALPAKSRRVGHWDKSKVRQVLTSKVTKIYLVLYVLLLVKLYPAVYVCLHFEIAK